MNILVSRIGTLLLALGLVMGLCVAPSWAAEEDEGGDVKGGKAAPVAMLMQPQGMVEHSKDGANWKPVKRNKFLFPGHQVRTGGDGAVQLVIQATGQSQAMAANTLVSVTDGGVQALSGQLGAPESAQGGLVSGLEKRFAKAQRYTTVRRGAPVKKDEAVELKTVRKIHVNAQYPELVWGHVGEGYSYRLTIDGKSVDVNASDANMVRHALAGLSPGEHNYQVDVLKDGQLVYQQPRPGTVVWEESSLPPLPGEDTLLYAMRLEDAGFVVAAMEQYRKHFAENPDDNDMRPMLVQIYNTLKLGNLQRTEAKLYNKMLSEK
ncbi:MAG: hypothetical protein H7831_04005 [Magnetococcus sp. WYHC-3]